MPQIPKVPQKANRWIVIGSLALVAVSQFIGTNESLLGLTDSTVTTIASIVGLVTYLARIIAPAD